MEGSNFWTEIAQSGELKDSTRAWTKRQYSGFKIAQSGELKDSSGALTKHQFSGSEISQSGKQGTRVPGEV